MATPHEGATPTIVDDDPAPDAQVRRDRQQLALEQPERYEVQGLLAKGGQSLVYAARDASLGRLVVFKQLRDDRDEVGARAGAELTSKELRFLREARITAQLDHPGIPPVHEVGRRADGSLFATQKLVRGGTLAEAMARCGTLEERLALLPTLLAVCQAVAYAHARGVLHRDLKPQNVMLGDLGEVFVVDWGLARTGGLGPGTQLPPPLGAPVQAAESPLSARAAALAPRQDAAPPSTAPGSTPGSTPPGAVDSLLDSDATQDGAVMGTPHYMSPEQAAGSSGLVSERSDVFSLGVLLYELLSGRRPFDGANTRAILWSVMTASPLPLREVCPELPVELAAVVERALRRQPAERYAHAGELAEELRHFLAGRLVQAHTYTPGELVRRWARRYRALLTLGAVFALALAAVAGLGLRRVLIEQERANREARVAQQVSGFLTSVFQVSDPSVARGTAVTARELLDKAAKEVEAGSGQDPLLRARLMTAMGDTYYGLGLFIDARRLYEAAYRIDGEALGPEHPDTLALSSSLARLQDDEGDLAGAEARYRTTLEAQARVLGPEALPTLTTAKNLASTLFAEGKLDEAESLSRRALTSLRKRPGPDDATSLAALNILAISVLKQGRQVEADQLLVEVVAAKRRLLGGDHPSTLKSVHNLAAARYFQGHVPEATTLYRELLAASRRVLGPDHPSTIDALTNLGACLGELPFTEESLQVSREAWELGRRKLGPDHVDVLLAEENLGYAMVRAGQLEEGAAHAVRAALALRKQLGDSAYQVGESEATVARVLLLQGRKDEAFAALGAAIGHGLGLENITVPNLLGPFGAVRDDPRFLQLVERARARKPSP
jgi:serine/threonine protein kinase